MLDPITLSALISGGSGLLGGLMSQFSGGNQMSKEGRRIQDATLPTVRLQQIYLRDLLRGAGWGGTGVGGAPYGESGSPLVNLINKALATNYAPLEDVGASKEYGLALDNIRQSYAQKTSEILNTLAARGAIRSGASQNELTKLGLGQMGEERQAYLDLSALQAARYKDAVGKAMEILSGSPSPNTTYATGKIGEDVYTQGQNLLNTTGSGVAGFGNKLSQAIYLNSILDKYYGRGQGRDPNVLKDLLDIDRA